jgi:hypothetical protein
MSGSTFFGSLSLSPLYSKRLFTFTLGHEKYLTIFSFYTSKIWKLRRTKSISLTDFSLILNSLIFIRLFPDDVDLAPKLRSVFKTFGVPPKMSCIIKLLPKQSERSFYAGRIIFDFSITTSVESLQDALTNLRIVLNSVHSEMEDYDTFVKKCDCHTEVLSFFRSINNEEINIISFPGQVVKLCNSTCLAILFGLRAVCDVKDLSDYDLVFKQLYSAKLDVSDLNELERLSLDTIFTEDKSSKIVELNDHSSISLSTPSGSTTVLNRQKHSTDPIGSGKRKFSMSIVGKNTIFILNSKGEFLKEYKITDTL